MIFKRPRNRYGQTSSPVTPYQKAAQVWDARMGSALVQARNWRRMAFGALSLSLILSGGVIWQAGRSHIVPYVVELEARGAARAVRSAVETYQPTDAQIAFHLASFIEKVRSLPIDPIIVRQNWLQAYDYVTKHAANSLNEYAIKADPFSLVGEQTVAIDITSIVRASDTSFQIRWVERRYINGSLAITERWTALATVQIDPPRDADTLRKNPLGIYVTSLNWSRELEVVQPPVAPGRQMSSPSKSIPGDPK